MKNRSIVFMIVFVVFGLSSACNVFRPFVTRFCDQLSGTKPRTIEWNEAGKNFALRIGQERVYFNAAETHISKNYTTFTFGPVVGKLQVLTGDVFVHAEAHFDVDGLPNFHWVVQDALLKVNLGGEWQIAHLEQKLRLIKSSKYSSKKLYSGVRFREICN